MSDGFFLVLQRYMPKQLVTRLAGRFAASHKSALTKWAIIRFIRHYNVDMSEAADPDIENYPTFNSFFARALRPDVRPLSKADWVCPVDGVVSQFGRIEGARLIQAKKHSYTTMALLADAALGAQFAQAHYATIYLSPRDYHRVHMPCSARLLRMTHIPGKLYSVNHTTARHIPDLYAKNERVVCIFEEREGQGRQFAMVLVGATIVGSIATEWHGVVTPPRLSTPRTWQYEDQYIVFRKGDEMGRFLMGSTVIVLFPEGDLYFNARLKKGRPVRMGEHMANDLPAAPVSSPASPA